MMWEFDLGITNMTISFITPEQTSLAICDTGCSLLQLRTNQVSGTTATVNARDLCTTRTVFAIDIYQALNFKRAKQPKSQHK